MFTHQYQVQAFTENLKHDSVKEWTSAIKTSNHGERQKD